MRVHDNHGLMMPNGMGLNRSNSQSNMAENSNQNEVDQFDELGHEQQMISGPGFQPAVGNAVDDQFQQVQAQTEMEALEE